MVIDVETWSSGRPSKRIAHVVDGVDGHADLAHLAVRDGLVAVVAHLRRQVEGHAEPTGARVDQLVVALVRLLGGAEPGVLPHRPGAAGVHRRIHAPGVGVLPRLAELDGRVEARQVVRAVAPPDRQVRLGAGFLDHGSHPTDAGMRHAARVFRLTSRTARRAGATGMAVHALTEQLLPVELSAERRRRGRRRATAARRVSATRSGSNITCSQLNRSTSHPRTTSAL